MTPARGLTPSATIDFHRGIGQFSRVPRRAVVPALPPNEVIHIGRKKRLLSVLLYAAAVLFRLFNRFRRAKPKRVLVLEPVGLGDLISFEPLVRELLQRGYEVVLAAKPEWRPLFPDRPGLIWADLRLPWASHNEQVKYQMGRYLREPTRGDIRWLKELGCGAVGLDTRGDIRSVLLLYWAGCTRVVSLSNYLGSDLPMSRLAAEIIPFNNEVRRWELNASFLKALDSAARVEKVTRPRLTHLIRRQPARAGLMPIAPWAGKLWRTERWRTVVNALQADGWEVVALCGPTQTPAAREQIGEGVPVVECGSIESWADEFNRCAFVITLDSGPMHLADALDVPVIALFGQGKLPLWAPSGEQSLVITHRDSAFYVCHPVAANSHLGRRYMDMITAEEVIAAVRKLELKPALARRD